MLSKTSLSFPMQHGASLFFGRNEEAGLRCSGSSADGVLVEFVELPGHPFWVGTQAHPEFKSRPDRPHPLFRELLGAALRRADGRLPRLITIDSDVGAAS